MRTGVVSSMFALLAACDSGGVSRAQPVATVRGAICNDATKVFVPGAALSLIEIDSKGTIVAQQDGETDEEGKFEFKRVANGTHTLRADKGAFHYLGSVVVKASKDKVIPSPPDCRLPTGTVTGRICDSATGEWVKDAHVYVSGPAGAVTADQATDINGAFSISNVPGGQRDIVADKQGHKYSFPLVVKADATTDLGITDCVKEGLSNIEGQICANAPGQWLVGATVKTSSGGNNYTGTTDVNGHFVLRALPPGSYHVEVNKGVYSVAFDIRTEPSRTARLAAPQCTPADIPVVVVSGAFDQIQKVVKRLQFSKVTVWKGHDGHDPVVDLRADRSEPWAATLLAGTSPEVFNYKVVMFNSGVDMSDLGSGDVRARRLQTLRRFVSQGGFVYASDHAYELIDGSFGSPIQFEHDATEDAKLGRAGKYTATIKDPTLATVLGGATAEFNLTTPEWAIIASVGPAVTTYLVIDAQISSASVTTSTRPNTPILVSFPLGIGRVIFSSFQTGNQSFVQNDKLMDYLVFAL